MDFGGVIGIGSDQGRLKQDGTAICGKADGWYTLQQWLAWVRDVVVKQKNQLVVVICSRHWVTDVSYLGRPLTSCQS